MSQIYEDFYPYRDVHGLNQIEVATTSQNGAISTVEYLLCLRDNKAPEFLSEVERVRVVFHTLEIIPGLSIRYPGSTEYDSIDNNVALLVFSRLWGYNGYAQQMKVHGVIVKCSGVDVTQDAERNRKFYPWVMLLSLFRPKNFWNNQNPDKWCFMGWYGRSPGVMAILDITAYDSTTPFRALCLAIGQFLCLTEPLGDTSDRKLSFIVWQLLKDRNRIWKALYKLWDKLLHKQYKNGISDVYLIYYGEHPTVKWSK